MLKWNDCQAMPFASTFVGHRTISSILEVLALLLVYERCARRVLGMAICGAGMASPARLVRVWPRRPPTKGTDGGGRIECDPCPRCNRVTVKEQHCQTKAWLFAASKRSRGRWSSR